MKAPRRFLAALFEWCDGGRPLSMLEVLAERRWGKTRFPAFLRDMLAAEVLIDASTQVERAFAAAQLPGALGVQSPVAVREQARLRAHTAATGNSVELPPVRLPRLQSLTAARHSAGGFADQALTSRQLAALLLAMYGIEAATPGLAPTLGHRSVASAGGFKSLRLSLVLIKQIGSVAPGLYDVGFTTPNLVRLRRRAAASDDWCRALIDPQRWMTATGLIVLSVDTAAARLKYLGRALPFALIEAGAALQNGGLAAAEAGCGFRILGGYDAGRVAALCRLESERVLCTAMVGAPEPVPKVPAPASLRKPIAFRWLPDTLERIHVARAEVEAEPTPGPGWGRSSDAATACAIAVSEAVERYCFSRLRGCVAARADELEGEVVDPGALAHYAAAQHADPRIGVHRFEPRRRYLWVRAMRWRLADPIDKRARQRPGAEVWIPADFVYAWSALPARHARAALTHATSSGCATDASLEVALERAAYELIERDALARHWLAQQAGATIATAGCPADLRARVARLASEGCSMTIAILAAAFGPVALVRIESTGRHFAAIGTACGNDLHHSIRRAFDEAETIATVRNQQDRVGAMSAAAVRQPMDHSAFHAQARHYRRARVLTGEIASTTFATAARSWPRSLAKRIESSSAATPAMYWVDMSATDAPLDPRQRELRTVRVLIEGMMPIAFGQDALPRGGIVGVSAAARLPHPLA